MVALLSLFISGCGREGNSGSSGDPTGKGINAFSKTSADVVVSFPEDSFASRAKEQEQGAEVTKVILEVKEGSTCLIQDQALVKIDGAWTGTLSDLPIGPPLTFLVRAYDSSGTEIFQGSTDQILTGNNDLVSISLSPIYDGAFLLPKISQIQITPQPPLAISQTAKITVLVGGNAGQTISYRLLEGKNSERKCREEETFDPCSGTITVQADGSGVIEIDYRAPGRTGDYYYTIAVTNEQNNTAETEFKITVSNPEDGDTGEENGDSGVEPGTPVDPQLYLSFAPVVTSLKAKRSGTDIIWTAIVDTGAQAGSSARSSTSTQADAAANEGLKYQWSFDGGLEFKNGSSNPAVMLGYSPSSEGVLTLTVYGSGGSTTITCNLPSGQFPDFSGSSDAPGSDLPGDDIQDPPADDDPPAEIVVSGLTDVQDIWISNQYDNNEERDSKLKVGKLGENRSYTLIRFNIEELPQEVSSAVMYLYCFHTTNPNGTSISNGDRKCTGKENSSGGSSSSNGNSNGNSKKSGNGDNNGNGGSKTGYLTSMYLDMITSPWNENTGWFSKPASMKIGCIPAPAAHSWIAIDITPLYRKWKAGVCPNYGIQLRLTQNGDGVNEFCSSSFQENPSLGPKLIVTPK
ncbi:MAG: DNRLRE domain-containing protein [bacterium]